MHRAYVVGDRLRPQPGPGRPRTVSPRASSSSAAWSEWRHPVGVSSQTRDRGSGAADAIRTCDPLSGNRTVPGEADPGSPGGTVEDVRGFVEWLAAERELAPVAARKALGAIAAASVDLPAAERLGRLLHEIARAGDAKAARGATPESDEIVEDFLVIERVAPGRIRFLDGVGPIKVPGAASAVARPGWTINLMFGRRGTARGVLEVGNVYPETLA